MALLWKINLLIIAASIVAVSVAGDSLVVLASGGRFTDAGMVMLVMLLGLGAASQGQLVGMTMQIFPYTRQLKYFSILLVLKPLAAIVGSGWGLIGVASGVLLSVWLMNSLTLFWLSHQVGRIDIDWSGILRGLGLALLLAAVGWVAEREFGSWWALSLVLLAYGSGLMLVKPLNQLDMTLLNRGLNHRARFFAFFARKD